MFAEALSPEQLSPQQLDAYLEKGWFRMGQTIFTTNFIHFKSEMYSTIWLRIMLDEYNADSTHIKLAKRNSKFKVTIQPAIITNEKENLYTIYKQSLPFQASDSLQHLLFGKTENHSIYTTYEVALYDGEKLIACGFFDVGETSAEGITSFYNPDYKKYSLGKYLIYLKIQYCKNQKLTYFYPGYFVPGYSYFNYKLTIAQSALYYLQLSSQQWVPISSFSEVHIPYQVVYNKLSQIQNLLAQVNPLVRVVNYEYFDANLIPELKHTELLDFPAFVFTDNGLEDDINLIVVFDVRDHQYHLLSCIPYWIPKEKNPDTNFYSDYFLKALYEVYTTPNEEEMAYVFLQLLSRKKQVT